MAEKALVDRLIASGKYAEDDRAWLLVLTDGQAQKIAASCGCTASAGGEGGEPAKPEDAPPAEPAKEPTAATAPKQLTEDELFELLPPERREMYSAMRRDWDAGNAKLRSEIVANSNGVFSEADVAKMGREDLKKIHALAKPPVDHSAQGLSVGSGAGSAAKAGTPPMPPTFKKIGAAA